MSDDVSVARPSGPLTAPDVPAWVRALPWWEAYFALGGAGAAGYVLFAQRGESWRERLGAAALLGALAVWYVAYGRSLRLRDCGPRRGIVYLVGVLVLFTAAVSLVQSSAFALYALCPQAFIILPFWLATIGVVALNVSPVVVYLAKTGDLVATLAGPLPIALFVAVTTIIVGASLDRVIRQSNQRAGLIQELESTRAEVARLSHEAGIATERQRLAGEIHDTVAQGLSSVVMLVQAVEAELERDPAQARRHLALVARTARDNLADVRALVAALTPVTLTDSSLPAAVSRVVAQFAEETGVRPEWTVTGPARVLPTGLEVVLLRAAQESLANVRKHAGARAVEAVLSYDPESVALRVRDDGCGFDPAGEFSGYGLRAMRVRVEQVGGELTVHSGHDTGTRVEVVVPG